jgi:hypothetical protein
LERKRRRLRALLPGLSVMLHCPALEECSLAITRPQIGKSETTDRSLTDRFTDVLFASIHETARLMSSRRLRDSASVAFTVSAAFVRFLAVHHLPRALLYHVWKQRRGSPAEPRGVSPSGLDSGSIAAGSITCATPVSVGPSGSVVPFEVQSRCVV